MGDIRKPLLSSSKPVENKQSEIGRAKVLFDRWRFFRISAALVGSFSIIPGIIDYEFRYKQSRVFDVCTQDDEFTMIPRILMLIFSYTAILLLIPYRITYLQWKVHNPRTYSELPPQQKIPLNQVIDNRKKPHWTEYFGGDTIPSIILYQILPYPGLELTLSTSQERNYQEQVVCYYLAEWLYAVSYLRVIVLALALFYFGKYSNQVSIRQCEKFGVTPGIGFSFKCYLNERPMFMVICLLLVPCVVIFGICVHVFERPMHMDGNDFDYLGNCMWMVFVTMSTVGYGDQFPLTLPGRFILALSAFAGGIVLSMTFVAIGSYLNLSKDEVNVLDEVDLKFSAAKAIHGAYTFSSKEKKNYWDFVALRSKVNDFKHMRLAGAEVEEGVTPELLEERIHALNSKLVDLQGSVTHLIERMHKL